MEWNGMECGDVDKGQMGLERNFLGVNCDGFKTGHFTGNGAKGMRGFFMLTDKCGFFPIQLYINNSAHSLFHSNDYQADYSSHHIIIQKRIGLIISQSKGIIVTNVITPSIGQCEWDGNKRVGIGQHYADVLRHINGVFFSHWLIRNN
jgi:hypothetical protein